jgi:hypothetical protein
MKMLSLFCPFYLFDNGSNGLNRQNGLNDYFIFPNSAK